MATAGALKYSTQRSTAIQYKPIGTLADPVRDTVDHSADVYAIGPLS